MWRWLPVAVLAAVIFIWLLFQEYEIIIISKYFHLLLAGALFIASLIWVLSAWFHSWLFSDFSSSILKKLDSSIRTADAENRQLEERFSLVLEGVNDGIWDWDIERGTVYWSDRICEMAGLQSNMTQGGIKSIKNLLHPDDVRRFDYAMRIHLEKEKKFWVEVRVQNASGSYNTVLLRGKARRNEDGQAIRMAGSMTDVTKRKNMEEELLYTAFHDGLTGLANRRYFLNNLEKRIKMIFNQQGPILGVLIIGLDRFREVNEVFGHLVGDEILREMGQRLKSFQRGDDVLSRLGGDEFALFIDSLHSAEEAHKLMNELRIILEKPIHVQIHELSMTATMGFAFYNEEEVSDAEGFLANAYAVLRKAKKSGPGSIEVFHPGIRKKDVLNYSLEQELRRAVEKDELMLLYQPIVNAQTYAVEGFEALVRWNRSGMDTMISPAEFIPLAEETGLIVPMGEWILHSAAGQAKKWVDAGYTDITVAVNFSGKQFVQRNLPELVAGALQQSGLKAQNLKVEITETTAMNSIDRTIAVLQQLNQMGLQISIDDFGTGYSSLSYLKRYPIHTLKIDRSFVKDIPYSTDDIAIAQAIIAMAKNLKLKIIAEGVETAEQLEFLQEYGCDQIQGFYFSKPLQADKATAALENKIFQQKTPKS
jgi:diguanylate cyclase (GGDEF)-like protein/PAS domain S-box-containing protein